MIWTAYIHKHCIQRCQTIHTTSVVESNRHTWWDLKYRVMQAHYSNKHWKPSVIYHENNMVYLLTKNLASPKGWARKLMPRFLGSYKVLRVMNDSLNVTIKLLPELRDRRISPTFHTNLVWPYVKNNDILFPKREAKFYYDFGNNSEQEWLVDEILAHKCTDNNLELQVKWMLGDVTWEPIDSCKKLEALDTYLELRGVTWPWDLPWCMQDN